MGKRRTNAPHKDRYAGNDSESEQEEEEYTEPVGRTGEITWNEYKIWVDVIGPISYLKWLAL